MAKIKEIVRSGELGKVFYISSTRVNLGLHQKDISVVWDLAPHDLSMIMHWLDEVPTEVLATGKDFVQKGIPDVAFVFLRFASGSDRPCAGFLASPSKLRRTTIVGSGQDAGLRRYRAPGAGEDLRQGSQLQDPDTFGEYQLSYRTGDIVSPKIETYEPLQAEVNDFLRAIMENGTPGVDGYSGLRVARVLEAAERSLLNGGRPESLSWEAEPAPPRVKV